MRKLSLILLYCGTLLSQSVDVPLEYRGYDLLDRFETRGWISSFTLHSRPLARNDFAQLLHTIAEHKLYTTLPKAEQLRIEQFMSDFSDELSYPVAEPHFFSAREEDKQIHADLTASFSIESLHSYIKCWFLVFL